MKKLRNKIKKASRSNGVWKIIIKDDMAKFLNMKYITGWKININDSDRVEFLPMGFAPKDRFGLELKYIKDIDLVRAIEEVA